MYNFTLLELINTPYVKTVPGYGEGATCWINNHPKYTVKYENRVVDHIMVFEKEYTIKCVGHVFKRLGDPTIPCFEVFYETPVPVNYKESVK